MQVCTSLQTTMTAPHHSVFYRPDVLPAAQPTASKHWRQTKAMKANWTKDCWTSETYLRFRCRSLYQKDKLMMCSRVQIYSAIIFSALTLLVGRQERHLACKKTEWWGAGIVVCLEQGADLHIAQLMPLPLTVSCFTKIQIGFTFLVPTQLGSPGKMAIKRVCVFCIFGALLEAVLRCKIFCECIRCSFCR